MQQNNNSMYFITKRDSETGRKFDVLVEKIDKLGKANKAIATKYGFNKWQAWSIGGGIAAAIFELEPESKLWSKKKGEDNAY